MDLIFKIGLILMPFENLFIAPSAGWATITPIIFFIYVLFNLKFAIKSIYKYKYIFTFIIVGLILSVINYIFVGIEIKNLINASISLGLGIISLISMDIFFRQKENKLSTCVKLLLISYAISLAIGYIQFISVKLNIECLKEFFIFIEKRSYIRVNRIQFTFTEPSFIGMHLFGILLPLYLYTKKRSIIILLITFAASAIIFSSGVRILIDIIVVIGILYIVYLLKNIRNVKVITITLIMLIIGASGIHFLYNTNFRVKNIINNGIYADGSLASRYFRINASTKGYMKNKVNFAFGYGLGNSIVPIRRGYDEAMKEYKSNYMIEMEELINPNFTSDSVSYCLYIRLISEFGIIFLISAITYLYKLSRKSDNFWFRNYIWILLYIYVQFESYAFYTIWLYIVLLNLNTKKYNENVIGEKKDE